MRPSRNFLKQWRYELKHGFSEADLEREFLLFKELKNLFNPK